MKSRNSIVVRILREPAATASILAETMQRVRKLGAVSAVALLALSAHSWAASTTAIPQSCANLPNCALNSPVQPLPVMNTAPAAALDGSGTILIADVPQALFGGEVPVNGWMVCVAPSVPGLAYVDDQDPAATSSIPIGSDGANIPVSACFATPSGYKPPGAVTVYGPAGLRFFARSW